MNGDLSCIVNHEARLRADPCLCPPGRRVRRFPIRWLRYWFVHQLLLAEQQRQQRPLTVCEVGISNGEMLRFMNAVGAPMWSRWVGVDCALQHDTLKGLGYAALNEADLQSSVSWCDAGYDALVLLHVLEHLREPEPAVARLAAAMRPGAVLIGGYPSVPDWCVEIRERQIRKTALPHGHVSVFSPRRTRAMAAAAGLGVEFLAGAFCVRAGGFVLEDFEWWTRFNLGFGRLVPSWPGEIYWVMRKPRDGNTNGLV
jgi:2-polyprenyl-3-methyl-5-hydroxy-6-metoxy-1,4-benzoquinol methylase